MTNFQQNEKVLSATIIASISVVIVLAFLSAYLLKIQSIGQEKLKDTCQLRYESFLLADQLRQSSDDLTRMVRSYAATGDSKFETYFWDILAIRKGTKPRPINYQRIYWDFMTVSQPIPPCPTGTVSSLDSLMKKAGFTEKEFQLLNQAKNNSDNLVALETIAMKAMKGEFQDKNGRFSIIGEPSPEMAITILFGAEYHEAKKNIMAPIDEFFAAIDQRTSQNVNKANAHVVFYQKLLILAFVALFINAFLLFLATSRYQKISFNKLHKAIDKQSLEIKQRKRAEEALEESNRKLATLSITDGLTGIANRRHFEEVFLLEYDRHIRSGSTLTIILLDIDFFKSFNDTYGHIAGDKCLQKISLLVVNSVTRPADLVARYGGEEFICILPETGRSGAIKVANRIRQNILASSIPHKESSVADYVTASLGVVTTQCVAIQSTEDLIAQADRLLYNAKEYGRNQVQLMPLSVGSGEIKGNFVQLTWQDSFCCGHQLIDSQHKALFNIANDLLEAIISDYPAPDISVQISLLFTEIEKHFHDEESIIESFCFPGLDEHAKFHSELLSKGLKLSEKFETSRLGVGEVFHFLAHDVVMLHLLEEDRKYFPFIREE